MTSVLCRQEGTLGRITLNRPAALNALDLEMIRSMLATLDAWENDSAITAILLDGAGDRAFCAGGDIAVVHESACGDPAAARELWREEYRLDARIARYGKPVVAVLNGITMGGGVGIGSHASIRIATERTLLAMPEVGIGLAPDVGGSLLLSRAPGEVGTYLALTGDRIQAADTVYCGLADHVTDSSDVGALVADLVAGEPIDLVVDKYARPTGQESLAEARPWIDACFSGASAEEIVQRLRSRPEAGARQTAQVLTEQAPTAVKVALRAVRAARSMTGVEECLRQDYRMCSRFLAHHDLREGIRAAIIDKDRRPRWRPASLAEVSDADVEHFFAPLDDDLTFR